ncbi:major facilitator superfamily transporter [Ceratobasidium sp. AG-Ba]|nr:major facilitator superfamily transporter [Ceratobasidium sp. AG-Ba]QRW09756.1 major facilitator superfamily transporter [Ceratobasidium sp. AG-Ba]
MSDATPAPRTDTSSIDEKSGMNIKSTMSSPDPDVAALDFASDSAGHASDKGLLLRIDLWIIPVMYVLNFGAARMDTLGVSMMGFKNNDYWLSLLVFFIGYIIFQLPTALLVRKYHPRYFLFLIVFFWGIVGGIAVAFVKDWKHLALLRGLLGGLQSGFLSVCVLLITCWYTRFELGLRLTIFYCGVTMNQGASPILIYLVALMNGLGGLVAWQWIFVIFGIIICIIGCLALVAVQNFPERATFLSVDDRKRVLDRLEEDRNDSIACDAHVWEKIVFHFRCWMIWALGLAYGCANVTAASLVTIGSARIAGLGLTPAGAAGFAIAPWFIGAFIAIAASWHSDRTKMRSPYIIGGALACIVGFGCMLSSSVGAGVFGTFLTIAGSATQLPLIMVMLQNNVRGTCKRAVAGAIALAFGAIGYMASNTLYISSSAPVYRQGCIASLAMQGGVIVIVAAVVARFRSMNARLEAEGSGFEHSDRQGVETVAWRHTL